MGDICRLCCSTKFVNHYIFDDHNSLYFKMSLYLPIKVMKNDRLPQKICDGCCYKIEEFYKFYNHTIEVQHRLRLVYATVLPLDDSVDLTVIKQTQSPPPLNSLFNNQSTQTDSFIDHIEHKDSKIKNEPLSRPGSPVKSECDGDSDYVHNIPSDDSEDTLLIDLKKTKRCRKDPSDRNGEVKEKRSKAKDCMVPEIHMHVKEELPELGAVKDEVLDPNMHTCCICFTRCNNKTEMLQHYKAHGRMLEVVEEPPAPPPLPEQRPLRCHRCQKAVDASEWGAHWRRHWERDRRAYRCSRCERSFSNHYQIYKHGLTHAGTADDSAVGEATNSLSKRFVCDLCPENFIYMRCLLAHRTRAHPEASGRAPALRCAVCARQFAHLNSLRRHLRAHSADRAHLCSVCGKVLSSREHLKFHLRIHTGYKPHVCKTCGKGFVKKCNLTLHERVHSGEKPHVCAHCGKAFSQRSTLVIHERYHSGARPYTCSLCGRGFVAKGLLSMHLKTTCVDAPPPAAPAHAQHARALLPPSK